MVSFIDHGVLLLIRTNDLYYCAYVRFLCEDGYLYKNQELFHKTGLITPMEALDPYTT